MSRKNATLVGALLASVLLLGGCAPEPVATGAGTEGKPSAPPAEPAPSTEPEEPVEEPPAVQEETCDWASAALASDPGTVPTAPGDDLEKAIIGSWQHTHFDTGNGYEALGPDTDIRYVFPSTSRILYCQDVKNATKQAENAADIQLDGTEIVLPAPATGYAVIAWDADTMVWLNHRDGSTFLLQRR